MKAFQRRVLFVLAAVVILVPDAAASLDTPYEVGWVRQFGTSGWEFCRGVSSDGRGNVYVSGYTDGSLGGANAGDKDAFVSRFDASGNQLWSRQLGTGGYDSSIAVAANGRGDVYISGWTTGSLGGPSAGQDDTFVSKYDGDGSLAWTRQLGTSYRDLSHSISADESGNVYVSGTTGGSLGGASAGKSDIFLSKYDSLGNLLWTRQTGTEESDDCRGISADGLGNVYISGGVLGYNEGPSGEAFVSKYDSDGNPLWTREFGTPEPDASFGVAADGLGNVFVGGTTQGWLGGPYMGLVDVFVARYDASGELQWTTQLGTSARDELFGISADGLGNVYISGNTYGSLGGPNAGNRDAFVCKYDSDGNLLWSHQIGTSAYETSFAVSADGLGNVYVSGDTTGLLGESNAGAADAYLVKLVPEPGTVLLLGLGGLTLLRKRNG